jgi:hypothetical protein
MKISSIEIVGNETMDAKTLQRKLKDTKQKYFWRI